MPEKTITLELSTEAFDALMVFLQRVPVGATEVLAMREITKAAERSLKAFREQPQAQQMNDPKAQE